MKEDRIGVVAGTTNFQAALELRKVRPFTLVTKNTFEELVTALTYRDIEYIINDLPVAEPLINDRVLGVALELDEYLKGYRRKYVGFPAEKYAIAIAQKEDKLATTIQKVMSEDFMRNYVKPLRECFVKQPADECKRQ